MSSFRTWAHGLDEIRFQPEAKKLSHEFLSSLLENVPLAICVTVGPEHHYAFANRIFRSALALSGNLIGKTLREALGSRYTDQTQGPRQSVLETGQPVQITNVLCGPGATQETTFWDITFLPVRDADDRISGVLSLGVDVTLRVSATLEADRQTQEGIINSKRLALAVEATELGLWEWIAETGMIYWSDRQREIFGISAEEPLTHELWVSSLHPDDRDWVVAKVSSLTDPASMGKLQIEYRIVRPDGDLRWISSRGRMLYETVNGRLQAARLLGTILDITERRTNEEARRLLAKELDHRVKNLFAMANAMVSMTARTAASPEEMATALHGRLQALARAHELIRPALAEEHPHEGETTIAAIIETILAPHRDLSLPGRILMECAPITVGARSATSLTLVLHELATNASKYGALSVSDGYLIIACWQEGDTTFLVWQEKGGPCIEGPPASKGFGSQLARKSVTDQLEGEISYDWQREGLRVELHIPITHLSQ
ncbi:HWE histidine kinase domain-containing protein [Microvirga sp. 2MCAF35]|uniref:HWE histidine kinase domain-containing protein n=1 Tax=Microvirga sp. 2MCAF35 TaxID=3232987 RepID=UPI003F9CF9EF